MANPSTDTATSTTSTSPKFITYILLRGSEGPRGQSHSTGPASVATPKKEILTFVLHAARDGEKDRHALVPLPKTYDEAVLSALRVLGTYMSDATPSNVILRCNIQDKQQKWVWADIYPENWELLVSSGDNVGVFEKISMLRGMQHFLHGEVYLSFGKHQAYRMVWSDVTESGHRQGMPKPNVLVRRPSSLTDAIQMVQAASSAMIWAQVRDWTKEDWTNAAPKIKFYRFIGPNLSTAVYQELPPSVYTNDDGWRAGVPMPGEVLGVVLPPKSDPGVLLPYKSEL